MIQLYFLSILCNAASGFLLVTDSRQEGRERSFEERFHAPFANETFRLCLGVLTLLTGVLKFFSPVGAGTFFVGDFLPALTGIGAGFVLVFDFYRSHTDVETGSLTQTEAFVGKFRRVFAVAAILAAALHFLVPRAAFF